ncbi:MAG: shikimate kinase [Caldimicrobium sp.]
MKILFIGFRGVGKTTLGEELAKRLGLPFLDADTEIEKKEGRSIKEIVEKQGWAYFRKLEKDFLRGLFSMDNLVCALGGGAVLHEEEMEALSRESLIIWVKASLDKIKERILKDEKTLTQRPSLTGLGFEEELEKVYKERELLYKKWAHFEVDTTEDNLELAIFKILNFLKGEEGDGQYHCRCY